jgi:hypothetical protein
MQLEFIGSISMRTGVKVHTAQSRLRIAQQVHAVIC